MEDPVFILISDCPKPAKDQEWTDIFSLTHRSITGLRPFFFVALTQDATVLDFSLHGKRVPEKPKDDRGRVGSSTTGLPMDKLQERIESTQNKIQAIDMSKDQRRIRLIIFSDSWFTTERFINPDIQVSFSGYDQINQVPLSRKMRSAKRW
ncbi:MAG: hypothetical protein H6545_08900 [Bacteroidales bacterium]|nr:hypothetical protein [Bacteroidales bacterium]